MYPYRHPTTLIAHNAHVQYVFKYSYDRYTERKKTHMVELGGQDETGIMVHAKVAK